jgi:hypothetical protein
MMGLEVVASLGQLEVQRYIKHRVTVTSSIGLDNSSLKEGCPLARYLQIEPNAL